MENPPHMARSPKEFEEMFDYLLNDEKARKFSTKMMRAEVLEKHTYHHRVHQMLELLVAKSETKFHD